MTAKQTWLSVVGWGWGEALLRAPEVRGRTPGSHPQITAQGARSPGLTSQLGEVTKFCFQSSSVKTGRYKYCSPYTVAGKIIHVVTAHFICSLYEVLC